MPKSSRTAPKTPPAIDSLLRPLDHRHRTLLAELTALGLVLRGSITQRPMRCGQPACRCKADPPVLHGPYYVWTRKVSGKTVTAQLPPAPARYCLTWSRNMRKLDRIVRQLQDLGLQAAELVRTAAAHRPSRRPSVRNS